MNAKKYPVGTKIKYIGHCAKCKGKAGKVVEVRGHICVITLPQSPCGVFHYNGTMQCPWQDIEPVAVKGEQLLFSFMSDTDA